MLKKQNQTGLKQEQILRINITSTPKEKLLAKIHSSLIKNGHSGQDPESITIFTPNPEMLVEAQKNINFKKALDASDIALPDGVGIAFASKILNKKDIKQIRGREFFLDLLKLANQKKLKIYLLGSSQNVIKKSILKIKKNYPNIKVKGSSGPMLDKKAQPISKKHAKSEKDVIREINNFKPHMLFVAFGAPKQELWIYKNLSSLKTNLAMGIGGSLDYFVGQAKLPPKLFSETGLEWLWRVTNEPKRFKRIYKAVIIFPILVLKQKFFHKN